MDTSKNLICLVLLSMVAFTFSIDTTFEIDEEDVMWFEFGQDAVIKCQWKHSQPNANPQMVAWKAKNYGIRKIIRGDVNGSFVFDTSPIPEDRQSEDTNWEVSILDQGEVVQSSRLTVYGYGVNDPENYTCEVDIGQAQKSRLIGIRGYQTPTIIMVDVVTEIDLRAPEEEEEQMNVTTAVNGTAADTGEPEPENDDEDGMTDSVADENALPSSRKRRDTEGKIIKVQCIIEDAYPKPSKVEFVVGEADTYAPTIVEWEQDDVTKLFTGTATLELDADASYDGKKVTCKSWLPTAPNNIETTSVNESSVIQVQHDMSWVTTNINPEVAKAGDTVQIQCNSDGNPRPSFFVSSDVSEKPDFEQTEDRRGFNILSVTKEQSGSYWCVAVMDGGSDPSDQYQLESENKPQLDVQYIEDPTLSENGEVVLSKGQSKTVDCYSNGNPSVQPVWKKDGNPINTVAGRLDITNAQYTDEALYTCETTNNVDTTKTSVNIKVQGACEASFKTPTIASSQEEAGKYYVKLECEVTGQPECSVDISSQSNFDVSDAGGKMLAGNILEFKALDKLTAPVTFFCIASSDVFSTYANATVTLDDSSDVCCEEISTGGLSTGAIIGIILLVLVILVGIPVACYFVRKRNAQPKEKASSDAEAADAEKESLHKEASSEDSDTGSLPPPPADTDNDHRLNSAHEMTTFSSNQ